MDDELAGHGNGSGDGRSGVQRRRGGNDGQVDRVTDRFELTLPPDSRYIRLARLMASGLATQCGLTLEEIEDVRIAVDEVCATLIEVGDRDPVRLAFELTDDALVVSGVAEGSTAGIDNDRRNLSRQILNVVTDDHSLQRSDNSVMFTVRKFLRARGVG
jgi:serine/threonine-protein kinase RsbW